MTEQRPSTNSTPPEERTWELEARSLAPKAADCTPRDARIHRRFGEACLRWPPRPANVSFRRRIADSPSTYVGRPLDIRGRPAIPRGHGPPTGER